MVQADVVDRADRHVGIGVGGQEDALGVRLQLQRARQQLDPGHLRHPLVDEEERDGAPTQGQLADRLERLDARAGGNHPVIGPVPRAQVALNCPENREVIVDRQQDRFGGHGAPV